MSNLGGMASRPGALAGIVLVALFLALAALIFVGLFLLIISSHQFVALLSIGFVALVFALGAYFGQALTRDPGVARALAYGFGAFGFGLLFLTTLVYPLLYAGLITTTGQIGILIVLVVLLIVAVAAAFTGARNRVTEGRRAEERAAWRATSPPSALTYATGRPPTPPPASPPPGGA